MKEELYLPYGSPEKCAVFEIDKGRRTFERVQFQEE
jgi:hypothetical protein